MKRGAGILGLLLLTGAMFSGSFAQEKAKVAVVKVDPFVATVKPFLQKYCVECHHAKKQSGGVQLDTLEPAKTALDAETWRGVMDALNLKNMPPKKARQPTDQESAGVTQWVAVDLRRAEESLKSSAKGVVLRRLNREEYGNTIRDLLGVDVHAHERLPLDDEQYRFDNIGSALTVSPFLLEKYLELADDAIRNGISFGPRPEVKKLVWNLAEDAKKGKAFKKPTPEELRDGTFVPSSPRPQNRGYLIEYIPIRDGGRYTIRLENAHFVGAAGQPAPFKLELNRDPLSESDGTRTHTQHVDLLCGSASLAIAVPKAAGKEPLDGRLTLEGPIFDQWPSGYQQKIFGPGVLKPVMADARTLITRFAEKAFRRPPDSADIDDIMKVVQAEQKRSGNAESAIRLGLRSVLCSPKFLYLIEPQDKAAGGPARPLNDYELATRLSYFLWSSMPDEELYALARDGKLTAPGTVEAQVRRMIASPKARAFANNFVGQWLLVRNVGAMAPDDKLYKDYDRSLEEAMKGETQEFFLHILQKNLPLRTFLDSDFAMLNERLARHYGIGGVKGSEFRPVKLKPDDHRGGLLTQASILTVTSDGIRTLPVRRGAFLLERILADPPPPPPDDVPPLPEITGKALTLKQRLEAHRSNAACAGCHNKIDALGFALENYNAIGAWRKTERVVVAKKASEQAIDASGTLPTGQKFKDFKEFQKVLLSDIGKFYRAIVEHMMIYALGRGLDFADKTTIDQMVAQLKAGDSSMQSLVLAIVNSKQFQTK
ncbi:MAG: DUF1592 domain-containing protein [Planctomycetia bacterium]|nr:DUF1592 domain-containing protein [Planctomycetia bacterium]